jgi:hypothetical protein
MFVGLTMFSFVRCAAPIKHVDFSDARRNYQPQDYSQVLGSWTRHTKLVRLDIGTVIEMWGTFKSWDFRQAYIEQYAQVYSLSEGDRTALYAAELEASRQSYEFHVAVQSTSFKWNDLEKEESPWRVSLVDGTGAEIFPASITVEKLPELYETQFFPNKTEFSRTYRIRFNRTEADSAGFAGPGSGRLILRVASPMGKAELVWQS